jgi:hypothetical protein
MAVLFITIISMHLSVPLIHKMNYPGFIKNLLLLCIPAIIILFGRYFDSIPDHRSILVPPLYLANHIKL